MVPRSSHRTCPWLEQFRPMRGAETSMVVTTTAKRAEPIPASKRVNDGHRLCAGQQRPPERRFASAV